MDNDREYGNFLPRLVERSSHARAEDWTAGSQGGLTMSVRIVTDSTCDLPEEVLNALDITVIPLFIHIGDQDYRDAIDISREEFYRRLPDYETFPTTAAPGPERFKRSYEALAAQGASEILSIHISTSLSATVDVARLAAQETKTVPVTVLDSRQLSLGMGYLVVTAARAAAEQRSMQEILALIEEQISRTHVFAALDTLEFLRRSGRMNWAVAGLGSLLQVKPLLRMYNGNPTSERVRTTNGATKRLIEILDELAPFEKVAVVHTHSPERAQELLRQGQHLFPAGEVPSLDITPVIGAHLGPGTAGFVVITTEPSPPHPTG